MRLAVERYTLDVNAEAAPLPNLPPARAGREIGVVADWQLGMRMDLGTGQRRAPGCR